MVNKLLEDDKDNHLRIIVNSKRIILLEEEESPRERGCSLTEAKDWRKICQLGIADPLRNGQAGDGNPRDQVGLQEGEVVSWAPL